MATERPGPSWLLTGGFLAAAVIVGAGLGALELNGVASPLDRIENLTLDWRFLLAGARRAPADVVIVAIDDETLSEAGSDAPPREMMARLVTALAGFHPRAVAIDIAFLNAKDEATDAELASALKAAPSVVAAIGVFGANEPSGVEAEPNDLALAPKPSSVLWPIDAIREAAQVGLANISTDSSGVPRYVPMIFQTPDGVAPSFALAAASQGLAAQPILAPDRIEIAGRSRDMEASGASARPRSSAATSIRRRCAARSSSSGLRPQALPTRLRRRSTALRRARKCLRPRSAISWRATDWRGRPRPVGSTQPRRLRSRLS
jgi:CHASE2 domain-containing sensor protein